MCVGTDSLLFVIVDHIFPCHITLIVSAACIYSFDLSEDAVFRPPIMPYFLRGNALNLRNFHFEGRMRLPFFLLKLV